MSTGHTESTPEDCFCKDGCVLLGQHEHCRAECSACNGNGYTMEHDFQSDVYGREHSVMREMGCNVCDGSGSVPLTDSQETLQK